MTEDPTIPTNDEPLPEVDEVQDLAEAIVAVEQDQEISFSNQLLEVTHHQTTILLRWVGICVTLITLLTGGGLAYGLLNLDSLGKSTSARLLTQIPEQVSASLATTVPILAEESVGTQVANLLREMQPTLEVEVATRVAIAVQTQIPPAASTAVAEEVEGRFAIIVASDLTIENALNEQKRLEVSGYITKIYKIGEYFTTTIGEFHTEEEVQRQLIVIRDQVIESAYSIDLSNACPYSKFFNPGFFGCSLDPWPE